MVALQISLDQMELHHLAPLARTYIGHIACGQDIWRLEMDSMAVGIALHVLKGLDDPYRHAGGVLQAHAGGR